MIFLDIFSVLALAMGLPANTTIEEGEMTTELAGDMTTEANLETTVMPDTVPPTTTTEASADTTAEPTTTITTTEAAANTTAGPTTSTTTKAAPEESTTVMEGSTSLPPLVPCPFECPAEFGYFEVEPCSPLYCSCSNYIGYLQAMINPIFIFQLLSMI